MLYLDSVTMATIYCQGGNCMALKDLFFSQVIMITILGRIGTKIQENHSFVLFYDICRALEFRAILNCNYLK